LAAHPQVQESVVVAREYTATDKRLVAYVVPARGPRTEGDEADGPSEGTRKRHEELTADLRAFLHERLPEYMVPSAFVPLDSLPLSPNGKLDRKALPAPDDADAPAHYVPPGTPTEVALAGLWAEVLGRRPGTVGAASDFFDLGGNSLLAMRLMMRVRSLLGADLALRELFLAPTLSAFARRVELAGRSDIPPLGPADRSRPLPLSYSQRRLWFIDRIDGRSTQYNLPAALRLAGRLDAAALRRAFDALVERHEVLRTTFVEADGEPVQLIHPPRPVPVEEVDLSALPPADREAEVGRLAAAEALKDFDLSRDLMLRAALLHLGDEEHVLLFTQHHIASDGWSLGILVREFSALYAAFTLGRESPLAPLPVQYADYAAWQRDWLRGESLDAQLSYWQRQLAGAPAVHSLPLRGERPAVQGYEGATHWQRLDAGLMRGLEALCRREGVTLFMLLESAFALLVGRYSHERDVVVGTPMAGRAAREVEGLVGFFINNLVLRSRLTPGETFREYLAGQKRVILDAYAHQHVPFETLVEGLNPERGFGHDPVFQLVFSLDENEGGGGLALPGLEATPVARRGGVQAKVDLEVVVGRGGGGEAFVNWTYRAGLFDAEWVEGFAAGFERLLRGVAEEPGRGVYDYELVGEVEREALLAGGGGGGAGYPLDLCAHELFSGRARQTPDAVAVACAGQGLTYGELDEKSSRLSRYLAEAGVGAESRVGIRLRRSPEVLIAVLG
ncbi:MAG TPA: condensation domain-containing protein, partial [Pyrinomonadaceae bacterium]